MAPANIVTPAQAGVHLPKVQQTVSRPRPSRSAKTHDKKLELAAHALGALAELGFARINLRDIANRSGLSLGRIHYYFEDKTELLIVAVDLYKDGFVRALEAASDHATTPAMAIGNFAATLVTAAEHDAALHRLWYDIRAQALFDPAFRPVVDRLETRLVASVARLFDRVAALGGPPPPVTGFATYLALDAWFQHHLRHRLAGAADATAGMRERIVAVLTARPGA